uniref:General transcription factor IIH subunit 3 n=1 Tax=Lingulaulax polyedra TaxID=160621 RepID=A0A516AGH2_LINPO|nr:general transcription factor IIH subunit 3 [Lingulodinium polyedra]
MAPASAPELLALVLDARLCLQCGTPPGPRAAGGEGGAGAAAPPGHGAKAPAEAAPGAFFQRLWDALLVLCRAHGLLGADQQVALFAAHSRRAALLVGGMCDAVDWEAARRAMATFALEPDGLPGTPQLAAALSRALCYVNRAKRSQSGLCARVLVLDSSPSEAEHCRQSPALLGCAFAAQAAGVPLDCLSLGREASVLLRQAASLAGGKHVALAPSGREQRPEDVLVPVLLFHFLPGVAVRKGMNVTADVQNHAAVCACHGERKELAHVCSCCLAVYCSDAAAVCPACGTRFRHDRCADRRLLDLGPEGLCA